MASNRQIKVDLPYGAFNYSFVISIIKAAMRQKWKYAGKYEFYQILSKDFLILLIKNRNMYSGSEDNMNYLLCVIVSLRK